MSLTMRSLASARWNIGGQVLLQAINVVGTLWLARYIDPAGVGVFLMLSLVAGYAGIFMHHVIGSAITQQQHLEKKDHDSIFWFNFLLAGALFLILWALKQPIIYFFRQPELDAYLPAFGIIFFLYAFGCVGYGVLAREHRFHHIIKGGLVSLFVSFPVALWMAYNGYGTVSLVVQLLLQAGVSALYYFLAAPYKPGFRFSINAVAKIKKFSSHLFVHSALEYLMFNIDNFLVGRYFGKAALGVYGRARQWVFLPVQNIAFSISRSFFPSFAQINDPSELKEIYRFSFSLTFFLTTSALIYMMVFADDLVLFFMGEEWLPVAKLFTLFGLTGIFGTIIGFNDSFITARGETGKLLRTGFWEKGITLAAIVLGMGFGLTGLVIARMISAFIVLLIKTRVLLRISGIGALEWVRYILPTLITALALGLVGFFHPYLLPDTGTGWRLILGSLLFLGMWWLLSVLLRNPSFRGMINLIRNLKKAD